MAANPVQLLRHGKALCGKVFRTFVETFNWLVMFSQNLKGDRDCDPAATGKITVDRTDPDHPVIRCTGCGDGGGDGDATPKPFDFDGESVVNCTFYWNGAAVLLSDFAAPATGDVYLCGTQDAPSPSAPKPPWAWTLATAAATAPSGGKALNFRLWTFADGEPTMDYRDTFLALFDCGGGGGAADRSCFRLVITEESTTVGGEEQTVTHTSIVDCYYTFGTYLRKKDDTNIDELMSLPPYGGGSVLYFKLSANDHDTPEDESAGVFEFKHYEEFVRVQSDQSCVLIPLYIFYPDDTFVDLRTAPHVHVFDDILPPDAHRM